MAKYFKNIKSFEELKSNYRALLKKNHPDNGGELSTMQEINAEFDALFTIWKNRKEQETGEKVQETAAQTRRHFYTANGWEGSRYDGRLTLKEIAATVRAYVKEKYPTCKFSVRTKYASMCQELIAELKEFPAQMYKTGDDLRKSGLWITETREGMNGEPFDWQHYTPEVEEMHRKLIKNHMFTLDSWTDDELIEAYEKACEQSKFYAIKSDYFAAVLDDVNAFIKSYNYEDCDGMQDYFDVNFYFFGVGFEGCKQVEKTARVTDKQPKTPATTKQNAEQKAEPATGYTITPDTDTRDGSALWVVKLSDRVDREQFEQIREQMKSAGGYYSRYKKGFIFRFDPSEVLNGEETTTEEPAEGAQIDAEAAEEAAPEEIPTTAETEPQEATESAETTEPDTTEAENESAAPEYGYSGETSEQFTPEELDMMNKGAQIKQGDGYSRAAYFSTPYRDGVRLVYRATIYNDTDEPAPGTDAKYCGFTIGLQYYSTTEPAAAQMADDINAEIMRTIPTEQAAEQNAGDLDESEKNRMQSLRSASYERDAERHYIDSTAPILRLYHADRTPSAAAVIRYLLNPAEVVREIATEYTKSHRAEILRKYIQHNRTAAALEEIKRNKAHRAHTLRAIHEATKGDAAKSYRVTLTNGATIKTDADAVRRMAYNGNLPAWYVSAQDRDQLRKDERGRVQDIQPQEVRRISHGGRVVWAA